MRTDLSTNPKVVAIAAILGVDEDLVVGKMHRLWSWADKHAKDGRALGNAAYIDRLVHCPGLSAALMRDEIDWLAVDGSEVIFPRWDQHNSQSAKTRALAMRRMKQVRADEALAQQQANRSATASEPRANTSATRGDKRREEKRIPPPQPAPAVAPTPPAANGAGGGDSVPAPESTPQPRAVASAQSEASTTPPAADAGTSPRSPQATALLDTLVGAGVWTSVASAAIDQAGVELVGACVGLWGKTKSPTPELLAARLRELVKPGSDIRRQCEQYVADLARKRAKAAQRTNAQTTPTPVRDIPRRHPPPATSAPVPGLTDHPAFRVLASGDEEDARLRVATSAPGCGEKP